MGATTTYNANEVTISFAGAVIDGGFGDGEFLRIEKEADDTVDVAGTGGDVAVSPTNDNRATVTITLLQTSEQNDVLSAIRTAGRATPVGIAIGPLFVQDRLGRSIWEGAAAWIQKPPVAAFDRAATPREWTLRVAQMDRTDGGNVRVE